MTSSNDKGEAELNAEDEAWAKAIGEELRRGEGIVSSEVHQRLTAARRAALVEAEQARRLPFGWSLMSWTSLGGVAASIALVATLTLRGPELPPDALPRIEGVEIAVAQDTELLEELEFVAWMVAMEDADARQHSG